jgi:hypothetical protein
MLIVTYIFVLLAIVVTNNSELVCPGFGFIRPQQPCVNQCSTDNDTCGSGKKCCYTPETPCDYLCLIGKQNIAKPGTSPPSQFAQTDRNWRLCDVDNDCRCKQKCCSNMCGTLMCISLIENN